MARKTAWEKTWEAIERSMAQDGGNRARALKVRKQIWKEFERIVDAAKASEQYDTPTDLARLHQPIGM